MLIKLGSIITVLMFSTYPIATHAQNRASGFENFKREMMSQVGKKITVAGVLNSAKLGWLVAFENWGIYLYAVKESDISKMNLLNRFDGHTVEVTGTLRYFPEPPPPKSDGVVEAIPPEHFYFDVAEARVVSLRPPRSRRSNRRRVRKTSMLSTTPNNSFNRSAG
jgi:hypothetical protein